MPRDHGIPSVLNKETGRTLVQKGNVDWLPRYRMIQFVVFLSCSMVFRLFVLEMVTTLNFVRDSTTISSTPVIKGDSTVVGGVSRGSIEVWRITDTGNPERPQENQDRRQIKSPWFVGTSMDLRKRGSRGPRKWKAFSNFLKKFSEKIQNKNFVYNF